jgi:rhodanese-related sulfurtransferase
MSVSAKEAIKMIAKNIANPHFKLIDVRTLPERKALSIPNSEHVPLDQFQARINEFNKENTYLIYCRIGVRSLTATNYLKQHGINAINMEGGILEWEKLTNKGAIDN